MTISLRYEGAKSLFKTLERIQSPDERKALLESIGAYGVSTTQQHFLDQETAEGIKWRPSRRAITKGGKTLTKSTRLVTSFVYQASAALVEWGTNVKYAAIHQWGGEIRPKNSRYLAFMGDNGGMVFAKKVTIPARPFLGISKLEENGINKIAENWLEGIAQ